MGELNSANRGDAVQVILDRFWADELGVGVAVVSKNGFHVCERADPDPQPRAIVLGTASVTILSLPRARSSDFEAAGLNLYEMKAAPRRYLASLPGDSALEVRGPAYLGYWPPSSPVPVPQGSVRELGPDDRAALTVLRDLAPEEWSEAGLGANSRMAASLAGDRIVAVAGYECWAAQLALLQVFCHPGYRRQGRARNVLAAVIEQAVSARLLPQYRARDTNVASRALAGRIGFAEYGWMATVLLRPI